MSGQWLNGVTRDPRSDAPGAVGTSRTEKSLKDVGVIGSRGVFHGQVNFGILAVHLLKELKLVNGKSVKSSFAHTGAMMRQGLGVGRARMAQGLASLTLEEIALTHRTATNR